MFVNKMPEFWANMHSMGLFYTKESEGSVYWNETSHVTEGDRVPPGGCFVYKWYFYAFTHIFPILMTGILSGSFPNPMLPTQVMQANYTHTTIT